MKNVLDTLKERGFLKQIVFEEDLRKLLETESVTFYIGFDPTADSLHVGHFVQLMAMRHMQLAGHKPIALIGGGTGFVGDPSGRTDMRLMMDEETIERNCNAFRRQMGKLIDFEGENGAIMVNNADWLLDLNYIDFLRDIGVHFTVNRMLSAECFKNRYERGLSFFEFNYMLMQAYDFLVLNREFNCKLELGGDDQWSNILAGADLIRRKDQREAYAMTFALLTTSDGKKMGKTAKGALWLDPEKTPPYDFFQYFRNVGDDDVKNCLKLLTFLPLEEIEELCAHRDERINAAKERLAYEVTKLIHSEEDAQKCLEQARAAFGGNTESMPTASLDRNVTKIIDILTTLKLAPSRAEARRLVEGGGVKVNDEKCGLDFELGAEVLAAGHFVLYKGKKVRLKVELA